jgi:hypothetical protein
MMNIITKDQTVQVDLGDSNCMIQFGSNKRKLILTEQALWQKPFKNKLSDLTKKIYIIDPLVFQTKDRFSPGRKLLGENEVITIGSIRNKIYFGKDTQADHLEPEHLMIVLKNGLVHLTNLTKIPITFISSSKSKVNKLAKT